MKIGERIRQRRKELGWTLREFADRMGYANHSTVARIERGEIDIAQSKISKFSEVLGVSVSYLMDWETTTKNNDFIANAVVKMQNDENFLNAVKSIYAFDEDKLKSLLALLK